MKRREYPNPPITEAICQFNFAQPLAWSVVTPGLLFEKLRDRYGAEPEQQEQIQAAFAGPEGGKPPEFQFNRMGARFLYGDDERRRLVIASPGNVSVNSLRPYEGWPSLFERARHVLNVLSNMEFATGIASVSVRYINQIRLGLGKVDLSDYVTIPVQSASFDDATIGAFLTRTESVMPDGVKVNVTYASLQSEDADSGSGVVLDIDCVRSLSSPIAMGDALAVAEQLKRLENDQFESVITDEARRLFK